MLTSKRKKYIANSKIELFRNNKPIPCKKHGLHNEWRESKKSNVQCLKCSKTWAKKMRLKDPIKYMLRDARQHAKQKGIIFYLYPQQIEDLLKKQNYKCALTGIDFSEEMFSLDKINPNGHYVIDNVQLLTFTVNRMKQDIPQDIFIELCKKIARLYA